MGQSDNLKPWRPTDRASASKLNAMLADIRALSRSPMRRGIVDATGRYPADSGAASESETLLISQLIAGTVWTPPVGTREIIFIAVGGGGGGGCGSVGANINIGGVNLYVMGAGGGGGASGVTRVVWATPNVEKGSYLLEPGAGGDGAIVGGSVATAGGTTSIYEVTNLSDPSPVLLFQANGGGPGSNSTSYFQGGAGRFTSPGATPSGDRIIGSLAFSGVAGYPGSRGITIAFNSLSAITPGGIGGQAYIRDGTGTFYGFGGSGGTGGTAPSGGATAPPSDGNPGIIGGAWAIAVG